MRTTRGKDAYLQLQACSCKADIGFLACIKNQNSQSAVRTDMYNNDSATNHIEARVRI
ncbi:hypothetical protein CISIN_1g035412mg [Citrus sinensis]|uniref:Uncharacterized protein n=1 Tax=Citrus sinensis TaxID=2711 RepID=A0A067D121_CITSI|nr:hypothetical protein CISIN_1g035412mg [Citrus sinensis]